MTIMLKPIDNLNDAAATAQLAHIFISDIPFYRAAIEDRIKDANGPEVAFIARKLKAGLALFGAKSAAEVAGQLEAIRRCRQPQGRAPMDASLQE